MPSIRIYAITPAADGTTQLYVDADAVDQEGNALPNYRRQFIVEAADMQVVLNQPTIAEALALIPALAARLDPSFTVDALLAAEAAATASREMVQSVLSLITFPVDVPVTGA